MFSLWSPAARAICLLGTFWILSSVPGQAAPGRVALLPVVAVNADAANGPRMTAAVTSNLAAHGYSVVDAEATRKALADEGILLDQPQFLPSLNRLGARLEADLVVYARVLVQGPSVTPMGDLDLTRPALILHIMVADAKTGQLLMSNQIAQEWVSSDPSAIEQIAPQAAAEAAAERLLRLLYDPASVAGQLVDQTSGRPIVEVEVFLRQEGAETRVALTDSYGRFSFSKLERKPYTITTHAPSYHDDSLTLPLTLGQREMQLALSPRPAAFSGLFLGRDGKPLRGQAVQIRDQEGALVDTLTTLEDGSFGRGGLAAGKYTLVTTGGGGALTIQLELKAGELKTVEMRGQ